MENKVRWEDSPREDLKHMPYLRSKGFIAHLSLNDKLHDRITPSNPPTETVTFYRGNTIVRLRINTVTERQEWVRQEVEWAVPIETRTASNIKDLV